MLHTEEWDEIHGEEELFFRDGTIGSSSSPNLSAFSLPSFVDETLLQRPVGIDPSQYLEISLRTEVRDEMHGEEELFFRDGKIAPSSWAWARGLEINTNATCN